MGEKEKKVLAVQRVLMDNGIEPMETLGVAKSLGAVLFNEDWESLLFAPNDLPFSHTVWDPPYTSLF